jgi:hypothetical protein
LWGKLQHKPKPNNYSKTKGVDVADRGEEDCGLTWGGLMDMGKTEYEPWLK